MLYRLPVVVNSGVIWKEDATLNSKRYVCDVTSTMLMGCAIAETTGLYALVIAILLIFVAPNLLVNVLLRAIGG